MPNFTAVSGSVFPSADYNSNVRDQVITQCTSSTRPAGVEGHYIYEQDTDLLWVYTGTAWQVVSAGTQASALGVRADTAAPGTLGGGGAGTATLSFNSESHDPHGWVNPPADTALTVPTGHDGLYILQISAINTTNTPMVGVLLDGVRDFEMLPSVSPDATRIRQGGPFVDLDAGVDISFEIDYPGFSATYGVFRVELQRVG